MADEPKIPEKPEDKALSNEEFFDEVLATWETKNNPPSYEVFDNPNYMKLLYYIKGLIKSKVPYTTVSKTSDFLGLEPPTVRAMLRRFDHFEILEYSTHKRGLQATIGKFNKAKVLEIIDWLVMNKKVKYMEGGN